MLDLLKVKEDIYYVGASDRKIRQFENYIPLTNGVSYNSYLIVDEKTCLLDTVDFSCVREFLDNIKKALNGRNLDYLVVHHMEPDHCASIEEVLLRYPNCVIVTNIQVKKMLGQFFDYNFDKMLLVKENDTLNLGKHELKFIFAPMVHWPEVMVSYELNNKILFSADAFGSFGALSGNLFYDEVVDNTYFSESRRYYSNIVGKYGQNVMNLFKKLEGVELRMICPLHGYLWRNNFDELLNHYTDWATYHAEEKAVVIIYASMYGNTENACVRLSNVLNNLGVKNIKLYDISITDQTYLISEIFRCSHIVLACPSYNGSLYPKMEYLINTLVNMKIKNRTFALIENATWGQVANKKMTELLDTLNNTIVLEDKLSIKSSLKDSDNESLENLAKAIVGSFSCNL